MIVVFLGGIKVQAKEPDLITYDYITHNTIIEKSNEVSPMTRSGVRIEPEYKIGLPEIMPKVIIGDTDSRKKVNPNNEPYCRVVCLRPGVDTDGDNKIDKWSYGTGFMTGDDVMVTAGHVVWHTKNKMQPQQLRIYLKQTGSKLNSTYYYPKRWTLSTAFTSNNNSNYDWCVLELQQDLGKQTGYFGYGTGLTGSKSVTVSGYPSSKKYNQYKATGKMKVTSSFRFSHDVDTEGGQSGSPAYSSNGIVWGIHTSGSKTSKINSGCLLTQNVYDLISKYKYN